MTEIFVSTDGCDSFDGMSQTVSADDGIGPFETLERARDEVRRMKAEDGIPADGVTVTLMNGDYSLEQSFELTEEDSGAADARIVYRAANERAARLLGGRHLSGFNPVTDPEVLSLLQPAARSQVLQTKLVESGITDFGQMRSRGFSRKTAPAHLELFCGGKRMTLARYPNQGFLNIAPDPNGDGEDDSHGGKTNRIETGFKYDDQRPGEWKAFDNVWVHGYWAWDWANSYEEIESIDLETRHIKTKPPHGLYGFRAGQRFYFLNVLEELDEPGEYFVDTRAGILYFWPPESLEGTEVIASVIEDPMIKMKQASHISFEGIIFEACRGTAITIDGGEGSRIRNCAFRNIGNDAIVVEGGKDHGVEGCEITATGDAAVKLNGGDRQTLTPCGHFVRNCHVHHFAVWTRCYVTAVNFNGVGFHVAHNHIHHAPHTAILYWANDSIIEFNHIHHVTQETGDCGAIYTGRDYTACGNVIRHNYIHDTGGFGMGSNAVYLDDCVSGQKIYGNIFLRTPRAAFIGGGRDIEVVNNIFIDCEPSIHVDGRGLDSREVWHNMVYKTMKDRLEAINHHKPPYSERYPELQELDAYYAKEEGIPPGNILITRNISVGGTWLDARWHTNIEKHLTLGENLVDADPHFVSKEEGDYRLKEDSPAWLIGFESIPVERIGTDWE